jgi:hypothetical protein
VRLSQKNKQTNKQKNKTGKVAQVVEHLSSTPQYCQKNQPSPPSKTPQKKKNTTKHKRHGPAALICKPLPQDTQELFFYHFAFR